MPLLDTLSKMTTASGRAYLTLLRADVFAVGLVGASARVSPAQRALTLLLSERATDTLCELLERASLPGRLYALLGLSASGHSGIEALLADYRHRTDEVRTQTACFISSQPVRDVVARIEDGTYSELLHSDTNAA
jgi:hypothetical protein